MKHVSWTEVEAKPVDMDGAENVTIRWLIGPDDNAPNFFIRRFDVAPGGFTPKHTHAWEHLVYILEGEGTVFLGGSERPVRPGDVVFVPPDDLHQFRAASDSPLAFLCMVPKTD